MRTTAAIAWLLAGLGLATGCDKIEWKWPRPGAPETTSKPAEPETQPAAAAEPAPPPATPEQLRTKVDTLTAENRALQQRLDELRAREQILSERLRKLEFEYLQQIRQIEALSKAPAERDRYKEQAEKLAMRIARLEATIDRLLGRAPAPMSPGAPRATQPAGASPPTEPPATRPAATPTTAPAGSAR